MQNIFKIPPCNYVQKLRVSHGVHLAAQLAQPHAYAIPLTVYVVTTSHIHDHNLYVSADDLSMPCGSLIYCMY